MTEPTQAQIEAAKTRLNQGRGTWGDHRTITAAAEVRPPIGYSPSDTRVSNNTAAAEVGGCTTEIITQHAINVEAATIERCAQVVKELADQCTSTLGCTPHARAKLLDAVAAIRALKDKP